MQLDGKAMRKIIPITDLQRQAGQLVNEANESGEPFIVTQRGRAAAVLMSVRQYEQIETDLAHLDELELSQLTQNGLDDFAAGRTLSHADVKERLSQAQPAARRRQS